MLRTTRLFALSLLTSATMLPTGAQAQTDPAEIDRAVAAFTGTMRGQTGGARTLVDRRLKLADCPSGMLVDWHGNARDMVTVRCADGAGWRIFVPIIQQVQPEKVEAAPIIAKGEAVAIRIEGQGFSLSRQGEALDDGAMGDWIRVRPVSSERINRNQAIRARVIRPHTVALPVR